MDSKYVLNNQYDFFNIGVQSLFSRQINKTSYNIIDLILNDTDNYSTSSQNIEMENKRHIDVLRRNEAYFIQLLLKSDFEDGNSNDAIEYVDKQLNINSIATSNWIAEIFSKYSLSDTVDNEVSGNVLYGLLRIIAYLNNYDCFDYIKGPLTLILKLSLNSGVPYMQEAGLMVIESWRSLDCLKILNEEKFKDKYLSKYAELLRNELTNELSNSSEA